MSKPSEKLDLGPLSYFSHELRTPLNAILGYTDLMVRQIHGPMPEPYQNFLEGIQTSGQHLLSMVNNILDYSKIQSGEMPLHPHSVDLEAVVKTCLTIVKGLASDKRIKLNLETQQDLPTLCIDETLTRQVIVNLITNAIKFSPKDSAITILLKFDQGRLVLEVIDRGIGMAAEDIAEALKPYGQVDQGQNKCEGTGLGLALVKAIIDMHKAVFEIESVKGQGTTARVIFPESCVEA